MNWIMMDSLSQLHISGIPLKQIRVPDCDITAISKFTFDDVNIIQSHKTLVLNRKCLLRVLKVTNEKLRQADRFVKKATAYTRPTKRKAKHG